jgi:hypothetical protein
MLRRLFGGEGDVEDAVGERAPDPEPALGEDVEHPIVLAQHVGLELGDAVGAGEHDQVLEQQRAQATALERVPDREGHLGAVRGPRRVVRDGVAGGGDDALLVVEPERRHQRRTPNEVLLRELRELGLGESLLHAEEAEVDRFGAELGEAPRQLGAVVGADGADADRPPVAQNAVGGVVLPAAGHRRGTIGGGAPAVPGGTAGPKRARRLRGPSLLRRSARLERAGGATRRHRGEPE